MRIEKIKIILVLICFSFCVMSLPQSSAQTRKKPAPAAAPATPQGPKPPINYEQFTHKTHTGMVAIPNTSQSRELKCESCHERTADIANGIVGTTDRNKRLSLKFPGHKACADCHVVQFTSKPQLTCTICHDTRGGLNARPPQRDFAKRYDFNALFDGKQHELHDKYLFPKSGMAGQMAGKKLECNFCHQQTGKPSFLTIASHPECYICHSPNSGDEKAAKKSDCMACHTIQTPGAVLPPFSDKYISRAYGALFTHKAHVGYVGGNCRECHTVEGGYNRPAPTLLRVKQHLTPNEKSGRGCFSCHDGKTHYGRVVFSGEPGDNGDGSCNRCHTRNDYRVLPSM